MKKNRIVASSKWRNVEAEPELVEGQVMGAIVLAAFLLYGVGSHFAHEPIGMALVVANSIVVALAGLIGFRLLRRTNASVGAGYLVARVGEAVLLSGGIALAEFADVRDADNTGYLLAMIVLGVGSIPFCRVLGVQRWIPKPLAMWGIYGYFALAVGAALELFLERSFAFVLSVHGGLFELVFGVYLIRNGFRKTTGAEGYASAVSASSRPSRIKSRPKSNSLP